MRGIQLVFVGLLLITISCQTGSKEKAGTPAPEKPAINPGEMVLVPAGEFVMGSNAVPENVAEEDKYRSYPEHNVNLPAFYIDKYEVTNGEFLKFTLETGYTSEAEEDNKSWRLFFGGDPNKENYPAVNLTWNDAVAYAKWAKKRLPTEEEWEKAARGTDGRRYPWGNEWAVGKACTHETGGQYKEIGSFTGDVSPYGAYDTFGNVQEWTATWFKAYPGNKKKSPSFGEKLRVARGASFAFRGRLYHLWDRTAYPPKYLSGVGLRCVKDAEKAGLRGVRDRLAEGRVRPWKIAIGLISSAFRNS